MMRKLLLLTTLTFLIGLPISKAQNREMPWAVGFNFAWIDAQGGVKTPMFRTRDNWNQAVQVSVGRYIMPSLNVHFSTTMAEIGKPVERFNQNISFFNFDLGAQYRFTNGYLLKENHWFDPYLFAGAGLNVLRSQNKFFYNGGLGIDFWLKEFFAINVQTSYNRVEDFEPIDQYWNHSIGVKVRIGNVLDTDGDGIIDKNDECPEVKGLEALKGCPDTDADGIPDKDDACPDKAGLAAFKGCPDTDGDGITDNEDACPEVKGTPEMKGCPDTDSDGVADKDDTCPNQKGLAEFKGCPDTDSDGIPDNEDRCPNQKGTRANAGCPEVEVPKEKEKEIDDKLYILAHRIHFETTSATITQDSYPELDEALVIMKQYPTAKFVVEGHTDNVGDTNKNKDLSQKRADVVREYFISKGIDASRIKAVGFGQDKPIVPNNTEANRSINRRVELHLDK